MKRKQAVNGSSRLAGIQYAGEAGISETCKTAIERLIQEGERIQSVHILSCDKTHAFLLELEEGHLAIKTGFTSGYSGEGPRTFSYVLQLLEAIDVGIKEHDVDPGFLDRVEKSALTNADLEFIRTARDKRPSRWRDYVSEWHMERHRAGTLWKDVQLVIPLAIIDHRLIDLALTFWEAPDQRLLTAYRRLEDIVRKRTGIDAHGCKLFSQSFLDKDSRRLEWEGKESGERVGLGQLFVGVYAAFRNPRAHRELRGSGEEALSEFLLVNQLFRLEASATVVDGGEKMSIETRGTSGGR